MNPILSIIIPCYNGERFLADAVNSVLKQPCKDLEIIIVDDGSSDSSGIIAEQFATEYENIYAFHIQNSGVSVARNVGINHAVGRYIGFLDSDDVMCRNAYDHEIRSDLESGRYDILSFSHLKGMDDMLYGCMIRANSPGEYRRDDQKYIRQTEKHFCSYLYCRDLFSDNIRFPDGIRYHEDVCFLFLASRCARNIMQYEKPWFVYRMNFGSTMHNLKKSDYILEEIDAWRWCMQNSTQLKDISDCEGNIFSYMVEYIRFSCMHGIPVRIICENVQSNVPFQKTMEHFGSFWSNDQTVQLYLDFHKFPKRVWLKYRIIGILYAFCQRMIRMKAGSIINQKLRYKLKLKDYLVE